MTTKPAAATEHLFSCGTLQQVADYRRERVPLASDAQAWDYVAARDALPWPARRHRHGQLARAGGVSRIELQDQASLRLPADTRFQP